MHLAAGEILFKNLVCTQSLDVGTGLHHAADPDLRHPRIHVVGVLAVVGGTHHLAVDLERAGKHFVGLALECGKHIAGLIGLGRLGLDVEKFFHLTDPALVVAVAEQVRHGNEFGNFGKIVIGDR